MEKVTWSRGWRGQFGGDRTPIAFLRCAQGVEANHRYEGNCGDSQSEFDDTLTTVAP
jgi:hypothetical protein